MRYPPEETAARHERILSEASRLFRERGLNGVTVPEIMKAAQLTHGPFYNHFDSKDALIAVSLERTMGAMLNDILSAPDQDGAKAAFLDDYLNTSHRDDPGSGCPIAALSGDVIHNRAARPSFTKGLKDIFSAMAAKFTPARHVNARGEAIRTISLIIGAMILARAVDDSALSEEILAEARAAFTD